MPPLVKIRSERDHMSAIERRIADYILDNAHLLRDYSSQQLASALGISQSSVVKFSQKLGFKGYPDLKYSVGQAVARGSDGQPASNDPAPARGDGYQQLQDALRAARRRPRTKRACSTRARTSSRSWRDWIGRRRCSCAGWAMTACSRASSPCACRCWAC